MRFILSLACLAFLATGCSGSGGETTGGSSGAGGAKAGDNVDPAEVLATVGGEVVTKTEFEQSAARKTPANGKTLSGEEKTEVLDKLVDDKILYLQALESGLDKDPKVQKVMINTLLREEVYAKVRNSDFSDDELRAYYEANKSDFVVPEKVQVKRILLRVTEDRPDEQSRSEAERIRNEVKADPGNFKELATKYSDGPYKRRGGDLGFISQDGKPGVDQEIVDKAFELDLQKVSDVFKTEDGYNVIYIANKRDKVERTFQQMKGSVLRKLKNERLQEMYDQYVAGLKSGVTVDVDDAKLTAIEIESSARPGLRPGAGLQPGSDGHGHDMPALDGDGPKLNIPGGNDGDGQ